jgi:CheY-like chemotaxis protein
MKILLVDDDAFLRDMYATKFTELGHSIVTAATGEEALAHVEKNEVDVVLTDVVMPGMNGIEFVKRLKNGQVEGKPFCIVLSNQSEDTDRTAATAAGAGGYIVKAEMIPSEVVAKVVELVNNAG